MRRSSSDYYQKSSGLYTANDYIRDLLTTIEDNKHYIKQLEENNKELLRKLHDSDDNNRELLKNYLKLEFELKFGPQNRTQEIVLCATEAKVKGETNPSRLLIQNPIADKQYSVNCEALVSGPESERNFINMAELKQNIDLPKKFAALLIEWRFLPMAITDGHDSKLLDISKWRIKHNSVINLIPLEGYPLRPNSGQILKMAFNSVTDFESFERLTINESIASNPFKQLDIQMKALEKYLDHINAYTKQHYKTEPSDSKKGHNKSKLKAIRGRAKSETAEASNQSSDEEM